MTFPPQEVNAGAGESMCTDRRKSTSSLATKQRCNKKTTRDKISNVLLTGN